MTIPATRLTYQEYLDSPETIARYDILDGEMVMAPAPIFRHQVTSGNIYTPVCAFVTEQGLGVVAYSPVDVMIQTEPLRTRQPDVLYVGNENRHIIGEMVHGGPDLVIEILSPGNSRRDSESKLEDYASIAVKECWLVSPEAGTVEVLSLVDGAWKRLSLRGLGDDVSSEVLADLELPVSEIFADA